MQRCRIRDPLLGHRLGTTPRKQDAGVLETARPSLPRPRHHATPPGLLATRLDTTTMRPGGLTAVLVLGAGRASADFTNSFDDITSGSSVSLSWVGVQPQQYPLYITAQVIDKSGEGSKVNAYRVNITSMSLCDSGLSWCWTERRSLRRKTTSRRITRANKRSASASGTSYLWTGAPYPLRWLPGGLYQLELRPMGWAGGEVPLLAQSPFFSISEAAKVPGSTGSSSPVR